MGHLVHRWTDHSNLVIQNAKLLKDESLSRNVCFGEKEPLSEELNINAEVLSRRL